MTYDPLSHAEISAVACATLKPETLAAMGLTGEVFRDTSLGKLYDSCLTLSRNGAFTVIDVANESGMKMGDVAGIVDQGLTASPEGYARVILEAYRRREASRLAQRISDGESPDSVIPSLLSLLSPSRGKVVPIKAALRDALDALEGDPEGTPTGFLDWDQKIGPLGNGHLVVIGARPAMGKTALGLGLALRCQGRCLFISGEQPTREIAYRALVHEARISLNVLRTGNYSEEALTKLTHATHTLANSNLTLVDCDAPTVGDVIANARREHFNDPLSLVVVDYLQRLKTSGKDNRAYEVGDNVQALKTLARELNIPVVVLAQVNRSVESRQDKRPMMSDLKDSGGIEQEADLVAMLYRDDVYDEDSRDAGMAELNFEKNRHGPIGRIWLRYFAESLRFDDATQRYP